MTDILITVRGSFDSFHPAERGTVNLRVGFEGASKDDVYRSTAKLAKAITAQVTPLHNPSSGPVTYWSSDQIRTWSTRPWNKDGKQLPLVHHSDVAFEVKFSDLNRLSSWVSEVAPVNGVAISGVEWALTVATKAELTRKARAAAVLDARDKALAYASSLGLADIAPVAIADVGMLGGQVSFEGTGNAVMYARGTAAGGGDSGPDVDLVPEDIKISASVDARFVAASS